MMEVELDIETFKKPLGGWYNQLSPFFLSKYGNTLYSELKKRSKMGNVILPRSDMTYKALELVDPVDLKAIIVGMSPYHNFGKNRITPCADGLAFSNALTEQESPSLKQFYTAIEKDLERKVLRNPDLSYLSAQGVLLMNASLTTEAGKARIHNDMGLWDRFNEFFYGQVLATACNIPIVLLGKEAQKLEKLFLAPLCHKIKKVEHPAAALYKHTEWDHEGMFNWINEVMKEHNSVFSKIYWDYNDYREYVLGRDDLPWD